MNDERIAELVRRVIDNVDRVAELGNFPPYMDPQRSLAGRVPQDDVIAPGFDAGIACCLGIIPEDKQRLSAILHGAYTPEAVDQVRREIVDLDPDSETTWWLAMSQVCISSKEMVDSAGFVKQVANAKQAEMSQEIRLSAARSAQRSLQGSYTVRPLGLLMDGVAYGDTDGCIQAAYLDGFDLGVYRAELAGLWFIGTFRPSLGLEDFEWSTEVDDQERQKSGPVHGSSQYVKASSLSELAAAVEIAKRHLSI